MSRTLAPPNPRSCTTRRPSVKIFSRCDGLATNRNMYARIRNVKEPRIQRAIGALQDEQRDFTACTRSVGGDLRIGGVRTLLPFVLFFAEDFAGPHLLLDRAIPQLDQRIADDVAVPEGVGRSACVGSDHSVSAVTRFSSEASCESCRTSHPCR